MCAIQTSTHEMKTIYNLKFICCLVRLCVCVSIAKLCHQEWLLVFFDFYSFCSVLTLPLINCGICNRIIFIFIFGGLSRRRIDDARAVNPNPEKTVIEKSELKKGETTRKEEIKKSRAQRLGV